MHRKGSTDAAGHCSDPSPAILVESNSTRTESCSVIRPHRKLSSQADCRKTANDNVSRRIMCPKRVVRAGLEISCPVSLQGWQLDQVRAVGKPCPIPISPKNFQAHPTQFPCDGITGEEARESDDIHLEGEASRFSVIAGPRNQANRGTDQDDAGSSKSDSALSLGDVPPAPWRSRADFFHGISHVIFESPREKVVKIALKNAVKISASL